MILLISPYQNAPECAAHLERATQDKIEIINTIRLALSALRQREFTVVVADENLIESSPGSLDALVQRMGTALPVILDLACLRPDRVAKLVVASQKRRQLESQSARKYAVAELNGETKSEVTALLILSELLLKTVGMPSAAADKLNNVLAIVKKMQSRLKKEEQ